MNNSRKPSSSDRRPTTPPVTRPLPQPAPVDPVRVGIDVLIVVVGLAIIVVRGWLGHAGIAFIGSGGIFMTFGIARLLQYAGSRRR